MYGLCRSLLAAALFRGTSATSFDTIFAAMQAHQLSFDPLAIAYARIDPIVSKGVNTLSSHLHTLIGPDVINSNSSSDQLRTGNCTALDVGSSHPDMSAYVLFSLRH
jgi:hypothetical protein